MLQCARRLVKPMTRWCKNTCERFLAVVCCSPLFTFKRTLKPLSLKGIRPLCDGEGHELHASTCLTWQRKPMRDMSLQPPLPIMQFETLTMTCHGMSKPLRDMVLCTHGVSHSSRVVEKPHQLIALFMCFLLGLSRNPLLDRTSEEFLLLLPFFELLDAQRRSLQPWPNPT